MSTESGRINFRKRTVGRKDPDPVSLLKPSTRKELAQADAEEALGNPDKFGLPQPRHRLAFHQILDFFR